MQFKLYNHGYSLLELLVVLLIFSLLAGITVPRLASMYDSVQIAFERDDVLAHLGELGYLVFRQSRDFTLTNYPLDSEIDETVLANKSIQSPILKLPEGWKIMVEAPILFRANGVCNGGILQLQYQLQKFHIQLKPPFCQPELITGSTLNL
ncbi:MAG: prepilin-type N-terminal cleavage/methylation domain-containing protein [Proteobacteria bacterium]|nr:prepilin-type N-terminal cleavage/methylation domain-containing protein [Pseudomonadota bacterium]